MSATPRMMARSSIQAIEHPRERDIDWDRFERLATLETDSVELLRFDEKNKRRIIEGLRCQARNDPKISGHETVNLERLKQQAKDIYEIIKGGLPDHALLAGDDRISPSDFLNSHPLFHAEAFEQAMVHTLDDAEAGKSVKQRIEIFRRLLRSASMHVTMKMPRPEAMALYEIREAFRACGMKASVSSTRPSSVPEGCETLSAFEVIAFEFVMPDLGSDPEAKKVLQRRLDEADKAILDAQGFR